MRNSERHYAGALVVLLLGCHSVQAQDVDPTGVATEETPKVSVPTGKYDWAATGYVAWLSGDQLGDMLLFNAELSSNKVWVAALSRRLTTFWRDVDFEVEGQIGKHAGPDQHHWEVTALADLRWNRFYWDNTIDTSAAVGMGLSYAGELPAFEVAEHGSSNQLLAYIMFEFAFSLPKYPQWALVTRIHHRSSAYGIFEDDIEGASNALGVGIKYRF